MTDEHPRALDWVDEEQLAARVERHVDPDFATLIHGDPSARQTIDYWINVALRQKGRHVGRG